MPDKVERMTLQAIMELMSRTQFRPYGVLIVQLSHVQGTKILATGSFRFDFQIPGVCMVKSDRTRSYHAKPITLTTKAYKCTLGWKT